MEVKHLFVACGDGAYIERGLGCCTPLPLVTHDLGADLWNIEIAPGAQIEMIGIRNNILQGQFRSSNAFPKANQMSRGRDSPKYKFRTP